ncbi:MAG: helix-turn-helix domain-containing protein [Candidatus Cloacimonadaceae bacterium]|nr:helix-turn-helix domain-containing protein [Candidatus Cloacimonadaceae bacterium]
MIKNIQMISKHSQIRELGNALKFDMLKELIRGTATCQQLADVFGVSKQKIHYNLNKLHEEKLIEVAEDNNNNGKEVYYRATAKNYLLDFALGEHLVDSIINSRGVITNILEGEYHLRLSDIAARILQDSLKLKPRQRLLIVTGKYNLPLVEKILVEAGRMNVRCTMLYQDRALLQAKYEEYSLSAFNADYEHFNKLLKASDVYLKLNGESRYMELKDREKQKLRMVHFAKSQKIIEENKVRVAVMPGLLNHTLSENAIEIELQFWQALDIDYNNLCRDTISICKSYAENDNMELHSGTSILNFHFQRILAECGSFSDSVWQSPVINFPGGEILMVPKPNTMNGEISADVAYAFGERIVKPRLTIENNEIKTFTAEANEALLAKAIATGGIDGRKVALVCMGTNPSIALGDIDMSYKQKTRGLVTVYWGENRSLGGEVGGTCEWFLQIETPIIKNK